MRNWFLVVAVGFASILTSDLGLAKTSHLKPTKGIMQEIFNPMSRLLPLVFNQEKFSSIDKRAEILSLLEDLDSRSKTLEKHARDKQAGFQFMSTSFSNDIRDALRWYKNQRYREARFILRHVTENCITCHSKLPASHDYNGSKEFIKKINMEELTILERARLELSTRNYKEALESFEKAFADSQIRPAKWVTFDALTSYLEVTINVKRDMKRPQQTFEKILNTRKDLPDYMRKQITVWNKSLASIEGKKYHEKVDLKTAKALIEEGQSYQSYPADRSGLVFSIVAGSILEQLATNQKLTPEEFAEIYYNLAIVEMSVGRSFWVSQVDNYLEMAIRKAPSSNVSMKAYNLLEENIYYEFTGSSGTQIPFDKQKMLDDLSKLIKDSQDKKKVRG